MNSKTAITTTKSEIWVKELIWTSVYNVQEILGKFTSLHYFEKKNMLIPNYELCPNTYMYIQIWLWLQNNRIIIKASPNECEQK